MYSGKPTNTKIDPILNTVSSALEAKMIGEIAVDDINNVGRFTLFEAFIKQKLGEAKPDGFLFLSCVAQILSDNLVFSLPERRIDEILVHVTSANGSLRNIILIKFSYEKKYPNKFIRIFQ